MISFASAIALAIKMAQQSLIDNKGEIPLDANFFGPLMSKQLRVPVVPNVEYHFVQDGDCFKNLFDIYAFEASFLPLHSTLSLLQGGLKDSRRDLMSTIAMESEWFGQLEDATLGGTFLIADDIASYKFSSAFASEKISSLNSYEKLHSFP